MLSGQPKVEFQTLRYLVLKQQLSVGQIECFTSMAASDITTLRNLSYGQNHAKGHNNRRHINRIIKIAKGDLTTLRNLSLKTQLIYEEHIDRVVEATKNDFTTLKHLSLKQHLFSEQIDYIIKAVKEHRLFKHPSLKPQLPKEQYTGNELVLLMSLAKGQRGRLSESQIDHILDMTSDRGALQYLYCNQYLSSSQKAYLESKLGLDSDSPK